MKERPPLGELELEALRFVAGRGPMSVGEAAAQFGEPRGLARTTILTIMERLRGKGYLARAKSGSVYHYSAQSPQDVVMRGVVREFVERRLGGSLVPFVAYLTEEHDLSDSEIAALHRIVERLESTEGES